jgi:hypothetical protein
MGLISDHDGSMSSTKLYKLIVFVVALVLLLVSIFIEIRIGTWAFGAFLFVVVFLDRANALRFSFKFARMFEYKQDNVDMPKEVEEIEEEMNNDGN